MFRGLLFSVIMLQCYVSTVVWFGLLFVYFHKMKCGEVWQLVLIFMTRYALVTRVVELIIMYFYVA